jgi:hypothetical protein
LLQDQLGFASPRATAFLADGLGRIAEHLVQHSAELAARGRRHTIKQRDIEQAWNEFIAPRQAITWTTGELRQLIDRLDARGRIDAGNLPAADLAPHRRRPRRKPH